MEIISPNTLEKMIQSNEDIQLIDVRTEEEVAEGIIPNAVNINIFNPDFINEIDQLDRDKKYIMICRSGARSGQACMHMMGMGFEKVYNLEGGMLNWHGDVQ